MSIATSAVQPAITSSASQFTPKSQPTPVILIVSCADTTGIVAAVAGFIAARNGLILESQHYDDPGTNTSFMRAVFRDNGRGLPGIPSLHEAFATEVAHRFGMSWHFYDAVRPCKTLIAASKQGHCLNSILHRWSTGTLPIDVVGVVSNHEALQSLAEWHHVPFHYLPIVDQRKTEQERAMIEIFERTGAELLVLARYMQILSGDACRYFQSRAINIHHSFLPGFKGAKAYHQAHARGVKLIGATAHYVTTDLDEGPIIEQEVARVDHSMSPEDLSVIGSELENVVLNRAIKWHAERRVFCNGNRSVVLK